MEKKAVVEVQLHWVFVMIAGAVILIFFIGIVARQRAVSEELVVFDIMNNLNLLISGSKVSSGVIPLQIYDMEIDFSCNEYRIKDQKHGLAGKPVFASSKIKGGQMILWSVPWKVPFKVDNLLYATSPKVRFVFLGDAGEIYNVLPPNINKVLAKSLDDVADEGDYAIKLVIFPGAGTQAQAISIPEWMNKRDVYVLKVSPSDTIYGSARGNVEYWKYGKGTEGTSPYFTTEGLLGAIFSDSLADYNCAMENAAAELNAVSRIYLQRVKIIYQESCQIYSDNSQTILSNIAGATERKELWQQNVEQVLSSKQALENLNRDLQYQSCPVVY